MIGSAMPGISCDCWQLGRSRDCAWRKKYCRRVEYEHSGSTIQQRLFLMIDTPHITQSPARLTAIIRFTISREEIRNVMGPGIRELMAAIAAQNIVPAGPVFCIISEWIRPSLISKLAYPSPGPCPSGRVKPGQLPAATVVRTVYHGPYEGLGPAWGEFDAWIAANGHKPAPNLWEFYVAGPGSNPDPASWRTELNRPLIAQA